VFGRTVFGSFTGENPFTMIVDGGGILNHLLLL
jgi:hypothetical protein